MKPNYDKLNFGRELTIQGGDVNNHGDCFNYGIVAGCDIYCPVLQRGECELKNAENQELYNEYMETLIKELGLVSPERIAQWVIDNRYGGSDSISNHELYYILVDAIKLLTTKNQKTMKQSQLHLKAATVCTRIEVINAMLTTASPIESEYLKEQRSIELREYSDIMEEITRFMQDEPTAVMLQTFEIVTP